MSLTLLEVVRSVRQFIGQSIISREVNIRLGILLLLRFRGWVFPPALPLFSGGSVLGGVLCWGLGTRWETYSQELIFVDCF